MVEDQHSQFNEYLRILAKDITKALLLNEPTNNQKKQVELLMALEEKFRKSIVSFKQSREIYKKFIIRIAVEEKNILNARPYFREKATVFNKQISPAIKLADIKTIQKFHINYNLVKFIKDNWLGEMPKNSVEYIRKIEDVRRQIIENNMPLAINRAKIFYKKVPKSHLTLNDMISIACLGLISGVDKWVGAYSDVFNGVCIGRMTGNFIAEYSDTTIYFYPSDKSLLYRANALKFRLGIENLRDLADAINKSYEDDEKEGMKVPSKKVTESELAALLSAASPVSPDKTTNEDGDTMVVDISSKASQEDIERSFITREMYINTSEALKKISLIQRKIIRLKGVDL